MSNQTNQEAAMRAAEEIIPMLCVSREADMERALIRRVQEIILKHFPQRAESVNGELLRAANNAWHGLNLRADASDTIIKWRRELRAAISRAESQSESMERELAEALRDALADFNNSESRVGGVVKARELLAKYDASRA